MDARDVDFTWKTWVNPKFGAANTIGLNLITTADISSDNLSITFHLKQPFSPFVTDIWVDLHHALRSAGHRYRQEAHPQLYSCAWWSSRDYQQLGVVV